MQAQTTLEELFVPVPRARGMVLHPELFDMWLARAERLSVRLPADDASDVIFYVLSLTGIGAYAQLPAFVDARTTLVSDIHSLVPGVRHVVRSTCNEFTDPAGQVQATAALVNFIYQDADRRRLFFQMCSLFAGQLEKGRRFTELASWPEVPFRVIGARQVELLARANESSPAKRYGLTGDLALGFARIAQEIVRHCAKPSFYEYKDLMLALCQVVKFIEVEVAEAQKSDQLVVGSFEELVALRLSGYPVFLKLVLHFSKAFLELKEDNVSLGSHLHFGGLAPSWKETLEREGDWFRATDLTE